MTMRRVAGAVVFPPDTRVMSGARVLIELRDISDQDASSTVLAQRELKRQSVGPGVELPFEMMAPEVERSRSLSVRVQVDRPASRGAAGPALLTTAVWPVPASGEAVHLRVTVQQL